MLCAGIATSLLLVESLPAQDTITFLTNNCRDCHTGAAAEGGLNLSQLHADLTRPETFAKWERIYDRVDAHEMPPAAADQPLPAERAVFLKQLRHELSTAHAAQKGTVLRRLNRSEYQNTLNDLFGTQLDLASLLPEDGRAQEFENVGASLGISMVHLQRYLDAVGTVFDAAIAQSVEPPQPGLIEATYKDSREAEKFVGTAWRELPDGAIVRFQEGGYPSGMMRGSNVRVRGRYRVRVTGYAFQSAQPITFSVGGTSFASGSEKPIYGFFTFPPNKTTTIEFETVIDRNDMIQIEPWALSDPGRQKRKHIDEYQGPGLAILGVTLEGPLLEQFPSRGHQLVFEGLDRQEVPPKNPADRRKSWFKPKFEIVSADEQADVEQSLLRVAAAAFREPVSPADVESYVRLFQKERAKEASFEDALRTAVTAVFCSPRFLYLQESPGTLTDNQLAARLAYFLTRTTPDAELLEVAAAGQLTGSPAVLREQTDRLLKDERFERCITDLCDAWLDLRELDFTTPDAALFPEFDSYLRYSMPLETYAFINQLVKENLPATHLVKSDFAMVNGRLAQLYDLPQIEGAEFRRVDLPEDSVRGGLLSQASVLKVTANGTNSSPVKRGAWVLERILGIIPQPPPPGIPGVEPDVRGAATLRELLNKHRSVESCNACHRSIDPPGFALEVFNPVGGFRNRYRSLGTGDKVQRNVAGRPVRYRLSSVVDSSGRFPDGREFSNFTRFRELLAEHPEVLAKTLVTKLLIFATGRELGFSDRSDVLQIVRLSAEQNYGVRDILHLVVQSSIFRNK